MPSFFRFESAEINIEFSFSRFPATLARFCSMVLSSVSSLPLSMTRCDLRKFSVTDDAVGVKSASTCFATSLSLSMVLLCSLKRRPYSFVFFSLIFSFSASYFRILSSKKFFCFSLDAIELSVRESIDF